MSTEIAMTGAVPAHLVKAREQNQQNEWGDVGRTAIPRIKADKNCIVLMSGNTELLRGKPFQPIRAVLLGPGPLTRSYFKNAYQPGSNEKPVCWSIGAERPSTKCPEPQNATCRGCPMDMKNSSPRMANTKACRYSRNIAVWVPQADEQMVFNMRLPATSLFPNEVDNDGYMALYPLIAKFNAARVPVESRFILIKCDPNTTPTKPVFSVDEWLDEGLYNRAVGMKDTDNVKRITHPSVDEFDDGKSDSTEHSASVGDTVAKQQDKNGSSSDTLNPFTGEVLATDDPLIESTDTYWMDTDTNKVAVVKAGTPIPDGLADNIVEISKEKYDQMSTPSPREPRQRRVQRRVRTPVTEASEKPKIVEGGVSDDLPQHVQEAIDSALGDF